MGALRGQHGRSSQFHPVSACLVASCAGVVGNLWCPTFLLAKPSEPAARVPLYAHDGVLAATVAARRKSGGRAGADVWLLQYGTHRPLQAEPGWRGHARAVFVLERSMDTQPPELGGAGAAGQSPLPLSHSCQRRSREEGSD